MCSLLAGGIPTCHMDKRGLSKSYDGLATRGAIDKLVYGHKSQKKQAKSICARLVMQRVLPSCQLLPLLFVGRLEHV